MLSPIVTFHPRPWIGGSPLPKTNNTISEMIKLNQARQKEKLNSKEGRQNILNTTGQSIAKKY